MKIQFAPVCMPVLSACRDMQRGLCEKQLLFCLPSTSLVSPELNYQLDKASDNRERIFFQA